LKVNLEVNVTPSLSQLASVIAVPGRTCNLQPSWYTDHSTK